MVAVLTGSAIIILSSFHVSGKTPSYVFDFIISSRISCIVGDKIGEFLRSISDFFSTTKARLKIFHSERNSLASTSGLDP